jgi:hypothetical protein
MNCCRPIVATASILFLVAATAPLISSVAAAASCDESIKDVFKSDPRTTVTMVRAFHKGEDLNLDGKPSGKLAANELCMVKLNVGPGHPGPADAPSTSRGIGIEIWLPSSGNWNGRVHILGGGGFVGNPEVSSLTQLATAGSNELHNTPADIADTEGSVSAATDTGHVGHGQSFLPNLDGSFAMNPDGSINKDLWQDFSTRGIHEMALKAKALTVAYYKREIGHTYFDGCSTGGRQGHKFAQDHPEDFDGILVGDGAIGWTSATVSTLYPQIVMQRDLGAQPLTLEQLNLVSSAAVSACDANLDGKHAGYISDPAMCLYDPTRDHMVLCKADGGENDTAACVNSKQAMAINKMWYGPTSDGSVPDPALSNGTSVRLGPKQYWFGLPRGTTLAIPPLLGVATSVDGVPVPFRIASDQVALSLQDPKLATPDFHNASGNGADGWKSLSYADLGRANAQGLALQTSFANINTDNPDLSRFRDRKGKMIYFFGMADQLLPITASNRYYTRAAEKMGGFSKIRDFYRYYPIPGMGHCFGVGSVNGVAGVSPAANPPLPGPNQLFTALVDWVERGRAPDDLVIKNADGSAHRPMCAYPAKLRYLGGDRAVAASFDCR